MRTRIAVLFVGVAALAITLAACGSDDGSSSASGYEAPSDQPAAEQPEEPSAPSVSTGETELGTVLVDPDGRTLYAFTNDTDGVSACYDDCASTWPAAAADVAIGEGLDESKFHPVEREDGPAQLAVGSWPLYTFSGDTAPGDVNGQGIGGVWFVVAPDGTLVR